MARNEYVTMECERDIMKKKNAMRTDKIENGAISNGGWLMVQ